MSYRKQNRRARGVKSHARGLLCSASLVAALGAVPASAQSVTSTGTLTPGSVQSPVWTIGAPLIVGDGSDGTLAIADGGSVTDTLGTIGNGATGTVAVSGTDGSGHASTWTNSGDLTVGQSSNGNGLLTIASGGVVRNAKAHIGLDLGSTGEVDVAGTGSSWINSNEIRVGENGTGTLTVTDGGSVSSTNNGAYFWVGYGATGTGTVTVSGVDASGARSTITTLNRTYIGNAGNGTLNILDGGLFSSEYTMQIGELLNSVGLTEVSGVNAATGDRSTLNIVNNVLWVGDGGNGTLNVKDGGLVDVNTSFVVGGVVGGQGLAVVDGVNQPSGIRSEITANDVTVGNQSQGELDITNGGLVSATSYIDMGEYANVVGVINVDGVAPGANIRSTLTTSNNIDVGWLGTGTLNVSNGGAANDVQGFIGYLAGSHGTATISGQDGNGNASTWTNSSDLVIGQDGTGTLNVTDGGVVSNAVGYIGADAGSVGTVTVSGRGGNGAASSWANAGSLLVGDSGTGTLIIEDGGAVSAGDISYVGRDVGSQGTVTVSGQDANGNASTWTNSSDLVIGQFGTGSLTIMDGGVVSDATGYIGASGGRTGTATVTGIGGNGAASSWNNSGDLNVGDGGTGTLNVQAGGTVNVTGNLSVGFDGTGTLNITNGGKVVSGLGAIGNGAGSGAALVSGPGSTWETAGRISVGLFGAGSLRIEDGGVISSNEGIVGDSTQGDAVVTGAGSRWDNAGQFTVGSFATGTLRIEDGASVTSNQGYIGANADGSVVVTGAGTSWRIVPFNLNIGFNAVGSLAIEDGALVRAEGGVTLGDGPAAGSGTLTLQGTAGNLAVLETFGIEAGAGTASVTLDGGLLRATGDNDTFFSNFDAWDITLGANGGTIDTDGNAIGISPRFVGAGALIKDGAGTLTLTGANIYTGGTTIVAGTLQLGDGGTTGAVLGDVADNGTLAFNRSDIVSFAGAISGTGGIEQDGAGTTILTGANSYGGATVVNAGILRINGDQSAATGLTTVFAGATLGGSGILGGGVAVRDGGILAPGNSPGTLTIKGDLALAAGAILNFEFGQANVSGGPLNDLVNVGGNLTLDGTLNVSVPAGGSFGGGIYRVFNYDGTLTDNGLSLGTLPAGSEVTVQTSVAGQVNLVNTAGLVLNFWDGTAGPKQDGVVSGGDGSWHLAGTDTNWTEATGHVNAPYANDSFAIFAGAKGTVTIDNSAGAVRASGLQFATDGYVIKGDPLTLSGAVADVRVGDGTAAGAGFTATIAATLTGTAELLKTDAGTLILSGSNSYAGGTLIDGGTIRIASDANLGATAGGLGFDGGTLNTTADLTSARAVTFAGVGTLATDPGTTLTLTGSISGAGAFAKAGAGTLVLSGDGSGYSGAARIDAGTLAVNGVLGGSMAVNTAGRLTGTGQVGSVANQGVVAPGFGNALGTLTVQGDYAGNGGRLEIATVLGGDDSPTSRLAVTGATSGTTEVDVINRGGLGAQTTAGIKIIDVAGASAGRFVLHGDYLFQGDQAVIAGAYGYRLYQGGVASPSDGDWYLRSTLLNPGQSGGMGAGNPPSPLYQPGVPVYEAYAANLLALNTLPTLQQRVGNRSWAAGATPEGNGVWGRMEGTRSRANAALSTSGSDQDVDSWKMQLGVDRVLAGSAAGERLVAGITATYGTANSQIRSIFGNGTVKTDGYGIGATLTWYGLQGFYVDGQAQISRYESDLKSGTLGTLAHGNDGHGETASLEAGKRTALSGALSLTPQVQMIYSHVGFDRFTDPAGAVVVADKGDSLKTRWGLSLDHQSAWETGRSHVYGLVNLSYEWLNGTRTLVSGTAIDHADERLWSELGVGASLSWSKGLTLYGEVSGSSPLRDFGESYTLKGNIGLRMQF
jgi:fibronectin-binding autotransporter adhesin